MLIYLKFEKKNDMLRLGAKKREENISNLFYHFRTECEIYMSYTGVS